ncbi:phage recombination protein Bet [Nitrosovibrio sp. Nv6]|nr:phage recombination protein Bet [Nitrosovibrio sp. Nv6]
MNDLAVVKKQGLVAKMADRFGVDPEKMMNTLKETAFKVKDKQVSNEQMMALLVVADQYGLNPWTKEIYAFPDKGGIVPVVGVDGWSRIINEKHELDGIDFRFSEATVPHKGITCHEWVECVIYRKDRTHPTVVREYFSEVVRKLSYPTPWDTHPNRMHRHKALIQCARIAFGFVGIFDQDEAERIIEKDITPQRESAKSIGKSCFDHLPEEDREEIEAKADEFGRCFASGDMAGANAVYDEMMSGTDPETASSFKYLIPKDRMSALRKYRSETKREKMISSLMAMPDPKEIA